MKIERGIQLKNEQPPAERLKKQDEQLRQAAKMYEQHFMREMVKAMREAVPDGGLVEKSMGEKIFSEQLDHRYVESWSETGGVGLADMIYDHIKERYFPANPSAMPPVKGPLPLDGDKPAGWKAEPGGNAIRFQPEGAAAPEAREVRAPWSGTVGRMFTTPEGISSVELKHDEGLVSRIVFRGDVNGPPAGTKVEAGARLGAVDGAAPWLQWQLERA